MSALVHVCSRFASHTILSEERNQALSKRVTEHELGTDDEDLGCETLEEGAHTLGANHVPDNGHAADLRVEVGVLNSGLGIKISRSNSQRRSDGLP